LYKENNLGIGASMKGIFLLSSLFSILILIIVIVLMSSLIWIFTEIYGVEANMGLVNPREVKIRILFNPAKYESVLLSFLELEHQGMPMKKILNAVVIQNDAEAWMTEIKDFIDVSKISSDFLNQMLDGKPYLLKIREPELIISSFSESSIWQKVSTKVFLLDGSDIDVELYIG
jgi:hypothetical protein